MPLVARYMEKSISSYLDQTGSHASLVIPHTASATMIPFIEYFRQTPPRDATGKQKVVGNSSLQVTEHSAGLQVASLAAALSRRYHHEVSPLLREKAPLEPYHQTIEALYQGFVKSNTFRARTGGKNGCIYLWRDPPAEAREGQGDGENPISDVFNHPGE